MSTLSSANVTDVNLVLRTHPHASMLNMLIFTHNLGNWLIVYTHCSQLVLLSLWRRKGWVGLGTAHTQGCISPCFLWQTHKLSTTGFDSGSYALQSDMLPLDYCNYCNLAIIRSNNIVTRLPMTGTLRQMTERHNSIYWLCLKVLSTYMWTQN